MKHKSVFKCARFVSWGCASKNWGRWGGVGCAESAEIQSEIDVSIAHGHPRSWGDGWTNVPLRARPSISGVFREMIVAAL